MTRADLRVPNQGATAFLGQLALFLAPMTARLYVNPLIYSPANPASAYTEASYAGYTPIFPLTWSSPALQPSGFYAVQSQILSWTNGLVLPVGPIYGIYVTDYPITQVFLAFPFVEPFIFDPFDRVLVQEVTLSLASIY